MLRCECPLCGKKNTIQTEIFRRDFTMLQGIVPFKSYKVYECNDCGMIYAGDIQESMPLNEYYDKMSRYEGDSFVTSTVMNEFYEREADFISNFVDTSVSILDIGCAHGGLLHELKCRGFNDVEGLELSQKNAAYGKKEYGIDIHVGGIGCGFKLDKKYDLVILSETLEHIDNIRQSIDEIATFLKKGGQIFIAVPSVECFPKHEDLYQEFSAEHINYFTYEALINLMRCFGMCLKAKMLDDYDCMGLAGSSFTLWEKGEAQKARPSFAEIDRYLSKCKTVEDYFRKELGTKDYSQGFYIWGGGTQTAMLYQLKMFPVFAVKGIIDSNMNLVGEYVNDIKVYQPNDLKILPNRPILISSQYAQEAIYKQIKEMNINNEIWTLW